MKNRDKYEAAIRYRNRDIYQAAGIACFFKIPKNIATAFFGALFCDIIFYKISQNIAKYRRDHRYRDRKRLIHQVKYMTFSRRYCRYLRCRMFFKAFRYDFGAFCCFLHNIATEPHTASLFFAVWLSQLQPQFFLQSYRNRTASKNAISHGWYEAMAVKSLIFKNKSLILRAELNIKTCGEFFCSAKIRHQSNPAAQCEQRSNGRETFERSQQQKQ